jgi:hypothetical protein
MDDHQCLHIKPDGTFCGSPALRGRDRCYFHYDIARRLRRRPSQTGPAPFPLLEDANAVQLALQETLSAILDDRIDHRRASLLLWGLQIAAGNSRRVEFSPDTFQRNVEDLPEGYDDSPDEPTNSLPPDAAPSPTPAEILEPAPPADNNRLTAAKTLQRAPKTPRKSASGNSTDYNSCSDEDLPRRIHSDLVLAKSGDLNATTRLFRFAGVLPENS